MRKALLLLIAGLISLAVTAQPPQSDKGMKGEDLGKVIHTFAEEFRSERRNIGRDSLAMQRHRERQEQIQLRKAAYFTTKLELTPDEAQAFWPIYNEYWQKRDNLFMKQRNLTQEIQRGRFDDKQAQQMVQRIVENAQSEADLLREYSEQFAKVLSPQKLFRYYAAEESFKMELINDLRSPGKSK